MHNKQFTFRRFIESDADILFDEFMKYCRTNIQPYFSGVGIGSEKQRFGEEIQKFSHKQHHPPIIANAKGLPIGIYRITYRHSNCYHELFIHLWEEKDLTKAILNEIITQVLHKEHPEGSILIEVPGYAPELKQASVDLGLPLAGTIPNYLCHDDKLYHKYYYVITSSKWHSAKKEL